MNTPTNQEPDSLDDIIDMLMDYDYSEFDADSPIPKKIRRIAKQRLEDLYAPKPDAPTERTD